MANREAGSSRYAPIYIGSKESQQSEANSRVEAAIKAGTMNADMRPFVNMLEQVKQSDKDGKWYCASTTPYMAVDGRVAAAAKSEFPTSILTWFNTTAEPEVVVFEELTLTIPPKHALALAIERLPEGGVRRYATGTEAIRERGSGADKTHHIANAETSAIGRALGSLGYGLIPGSGLTTAEVMKQVAEDETRESEQSSESAASSRPARSSRQARSSRSRRAEPEKAETTDEAGNQQAEQAEQADEKADEKPRLNRDTVLRAVKQRVSDLDQMGWDGANKFSVAKHVAKSEECGEYETLADLYSKGSVEQLVAVGRYVASKIEETKGAMAEAKQAA